MSGHLWALAILIVFCVAACVYAALTRTAYWLLGQAQKRLDNKQFEQAVDEALAVTDHPAGRATSERLFTPGDAEWLEQQGISR